MRPGGPYALTGQLAVPVSRSTALRHLRGLPLPQQAVPRVIGVDEFALRRRYATIITDTETGRRVAVLPDRERATLESWSREHPGVEVVCRPLQYQRDHRRREGRPGPSPCINVRGGGSMCAVIFRCPLHELPGVRARAGR